MNAFLRAMFPKHDWEIAADKLSSELAATTTAAPPTQKTDWRYPALHEILSYLAVFANIGNNWWA